MDILWAVIICLVPIMCQGCDGGPQRELQTCRTGKENGRIGLERLLRASRRHRWSSVRTTFRSMEAHIRPWTYILLIIYILGNHPSLARLIFGGLGRHGSYGTNRTFQLGIGVKFTFRASGDATAKFFCSAYGRSTCDYHVMAM